MKPICLMLIDDHNVMRMGIKSLLDMQPDMTVVAELPSTEGALQSIEASKPNILLLDITVPGGGSLDLIRSLRHLPNAPRVLVLTMHDDPAYARSALQAGAVGYVVKTIGEQDLLSAIRAIAKGQVFIDLDDAAKSSTVYSELVEMGTRHGLSQRETEVLKLLGRGMSNQEVAEKLDISPKTVATYKARLGEKVGLHTTAEFVKYATDNGLH